MKKWYQVFGECRIFVGITRGIMTEVIHIFLRRNNTKMDGKSLKKYFQVHLDWSDLWSLAGEKVYRLIPRDIGHRTLSQYSVQRAPGKNFTLYQYILKVFYLKLHPLERDVETLISDLSFVEWAPPVKRIDHATFQSQILNWTQSGTSKKLTKTLLFLWHRLVWLGGSLLLDFFLIFFLGGGILGQKNEVDGSGIKAQKGFC